VEPEKKEREGMGKERRNCREAGHLFLLSRRDWKRRIAVTKRGFQSKGRTRKILKPRCEGGVRGIGSEKNRLGRFSPPFGGGDEVEREEGALFSWDNMGGSGSAGKAGDAAARGIGLLEWREKAVGVRDRSLR